MFMEEGRTAFSLFAPHAAQLLAQSAYVRRNTALSHPLVVVDEAQDTGDDAWTCVSMLAAHVQIICLADLEQQIFDYLPGGPERVVAIRNALAPLEIDLGAENHRSPDTEILAFANDILTASVSADAILISS